MSDADLIDQIERIRARNNANWMDLVRLALELDGPRTKAILRTIEQNDGEVRRLTKALAKG